MTACLIVRAEVLDGSVKENFDRWYREEHLPECVEAFGARRGWRGWSEVDASVHYAVYEFEEVATLRALPTSTAFRGQVAKFDGKWGDRVRRSRDVVEVAQTLDQRLR